MEGSRVVSEAWVVGARILKDGPVRVQLPKNHGI